MQGTVDLTILRSKLLLRVLHIRKFSFLEQFFPLWKSRKILPSESHTPFYANLFLLPADFPENNFHSSWDKKSISFEIANTKTSCQIPVSPLPPPSFTCCHVHSAHHDLCPSILILPPTPFLSSHCRRCEIHSLQHRNEEN